MKENLNKAVNASGKPINEEFLFRVMAQEFNSAVSKCTYVKEIHGKLYVTYASKLSMINSQRVELGDLWIFTFDRATKELRMCIMQTKYRRRMYLRFLDLNIQPFQWELLKEKPDVSGDGWYVPHDILNFQNKYDSITAYGIFYHDNISKTQDIDFLYTLPKFLAPKKHLTPPLIKRDYRFEYICPKGLGSPNYLCKEEFLPHETIGTCSIDIFEQQVLSCRIGVPVTSGKSLPPWVLVMLRHMRDGADDGTVIDTILEQHPSANDTYINNQCSFNAIPRSLVIVTDSERYKSQQRGEEHVGNFALQQELLG